LISILIAYIKSLQNSSLRLKHKKLAKGVVKYYWKLVIRPKHQKLKRYFYWCLIHVIMIFIKKWG